MDDRRFVQFLSTLIYVSVLVTSLESSVIRNNLIILTVLGTRSKGTHTHTHTHTQVEPKVTRTTQAV
jgi:hypothetical protein